MCSEICGDGYRYRGRVAVGRVPDTVSKCLNGGLDLRSPECAVSRLELLKNNFQPGDKIVRTFSNNREVYALGMIKPSGEHKILLINKRDREITVTLSQPVQKIEYVDQTSRGGPPVTEALSGDQVTLRGLAVAVVSNL